MEVPLVDKDYLLERTPGNGGWTYAHSRTCRKIKGTFRLG